ncbi:arabinan endo-1,5-alpha-L-arabinosidase [Paenibacillus hexagrammi]|uniref:Arabinan endo-1,5-alpha-L-arabinosidase n=1 Tax=Paenibacillus hexagrammi TaxID=2908839 RepID=A0ABY3SGI7_9BACL|nr:arabinan endo-1,5-alpha-L-arabinosidase [Paenibacillus sp. YPD9-1]UJF32570.1 arabinan endo-1,5-alpha-L-arabinosidase [Paenibacillus sp. YPD9-1]
MHRSVRNGWILSASFAGMLLAAGCMGSKVPAPVSPNEPIQYPLIDLKNVDNEQEWHVNNTHDPSIFKDGDTYYVFSTDVKAGGTPRPGIMVRKSEDLIAWDWVGYAFPNGIPESALSWTKATTLWAPDVTKLGDTYYLYYSASQFGTNRSMIGVATSKQITGPWEDQGAVIKTQAGDEPNAIDPNVVFDAEGNPWLTYGSFFGGIYVMQLNPATGKPAEQGFGTRIASRDHQTEEGAVEAPYMIYNKETKKYYLFVSYDSLFADYNVRVGRSDSMKGPFVDKNGNDLNDTKHTPQYEIGNKVLGGYSFTKGEGWIAPGHNSVLQDQGKTFMVSHARAESRTSWSYLQVRQMLWTKDGWPVVSPERYAGEYLQLIPKSIIAGQWERIYQAKDANGRVKAKPLILTADGKAEGEPGVGSWKFDGEHTITIEWSGDSVNKRSEQVLLLPSWDWELNRPSLVFTGLDEQGASVWGKQISAIDEGE